MGDFEIRQCPQCGSSNLFTDNKGVLTCKSCKRRYPDAKESFSDEILAIVDLRQRKEFLQAADKCQELIAKQPQCGEAYWQMLLCDYAVVYVKDEKDGVDKPTFFNYQYNERIPITKNEYYQKAIEFADDKDRDFYISCAQDLDNLLGDFFNLAAKENSYDIFISFKHMYQHKGETGEIVSSVTDDYLKAKEIYEALKDKYKIFLSGSFGFGKRKCRSALGAFEMQTQNERRYRNIETFRKTPELVTR